MLGSLFRFVTGAAIGAAAGIVSATFLAPKSGEQLKSDVRSYWQQVKDAGAEAEAVRRAELQDKFKKAKLKQPFEVDVDFYPGEKRVETKFKAGAPPQDTTGPSGS